MKSTTLTTMLLCAAAPALAQPAPASSYADAEELTKQRWQRLMMDADHQIADAQHRLEVSRMALDGTARKVVLITTGDALAANEAALLAVKAAEVAASTSLAAKVELLERARREGVPPGYLR